MKLEFDFPDIPEGTTPIVGVAVLSILDEEGEQYITGHYGNPSTAEVIGRGTFLLEDAKDQILGRGEYEE